MNFETVIAIVVFAVVMYFVIRLYDSIEMVEYLNLRYLKEIADEDQEKVVRASSVRVVEDGPSWRFDSLRY